MHMYIGLYEQIIIFGVLIIMITCALLCSVLMIIIKIIKLNDKRNGLIIKKAKIIEKAAKYGPITWFIVQFESGERVRLRTFNNLGLLVTAGDVGIITFRGKTIEKIELTL